MINVDIGASCGKGLAHDIQDMLLLHTQVWGKVGVLSSPRHELGPCSCSSLHKHNKNLPLPYSI